MQDDRIPLQASDGNWYWWDNLECDWLYDEFDNMIEATVCLCAAWSEYECCCGAWSFEESDYE